MKMEECMIVCRLEVAEHRSLVDKSQKELANVTGVVDKNPISIVQATITIYVPPLPYPYPYPASNDSFCKRPSWHSTHTTTAAAAALPYKAEVNEYVQSCTRHTLLTSSSTDVVTGSSSSSSADVASVVHSVEEPRDKIIEDVNNIISNSSNGEVVKNNQDNRELLRKIAENYRILNKRDVPKRLTNNYSIISRTRMKRIAADKHTTRENVLKDTDIEEKQTTLTMDTTPCATDETDTEDTNTEPKSTLPVQLDRSQFNSELNSLLDSRTVQPSVKDNTPPHQETDRYNDDSSTSSTESCRESTSSLEDYLKQEYAKHQAEGKCCDMFILTRRQKELRNIQEEFSQLTEDEVLPPVESTNKKRMSSKMKKKQALLATFRKSRNSKVKTNNGQTVKVSPTSFNSSSDNESIFCAYCGRKHTSIYSPSPSADIEYSSSMPDADNHSVQNETVATKSETVVKDDESTAIKSNASSVQAETVATKSETLVKDDEPTIKSDIVQSEMKVKPKIRAVSSENLTKYLAHMKPKQRNANTHHVDSETPTTTTNNNAITFGDDISSERGELCGQLMVIGDVANSGSGGDAHNNSISDSVNTVSTTVVPSSTVQCSASCSTTRITKRPRRRRVSRKSYHHDAIRYIKPRKRDQLRKTFSPRLKNLVDKSIQISKQNGTSKVNKNGQTTLKSKLRNARKPKSAQRVVNGSQEGNSTQLIVGDVHSAPGSARSSCADIVSNKEHSIHTTLPANNTQRISSKLDTDNMNNSSSSSTQNDSTTFNTEQDCNAAILHATSCEPVECTAQPQLDNSELNNHVQPTHNDVSDIIISDVRSLSPCDTAAVSDNRTHLSIIPQYLLQPRKTTAANPNELRHSNWNGQLFQQLVITNYDDKTRLQNINRRLHSIHQPLPSTNDSGPRERSNNNEETLRAEPSTHSDHNQNQQQQQLMVKSNTAGRQKRTYTRRQPTKSKQHIEADVMHTYQQIQLHRPPPPYPGQLNNPGGINEVTPPNGRNAIAKHQYRCHEMAPQSYRSTLSHMANPTVPRVSTDTGEPTNPALDLRYRANNTTTTATTQPEQTCIYPSTSSTDIPVTLVQTSTPVETKSPTLPVMSSTSSTDIPVTLHTHSSPPVETKSPTLPAINENLESQETPVKPTISVETQTTFDSAISHSETEQCSTMCKTSSDSTSNNTTLDVIRPPAPVSTVVRLPRSNKPTIRNRPRVWRYCKTSPQSVTNRRLVNRHNNRRRIASRASRTPVTSRQDQPNNEPRTTQVTNDNETTKVKDETTSPVPDNNKLLPTTCRQENTDTSEATPERMNIPVNFYTLSDQQPVYASTVINQGNEALQLTQNYIESIEKLQNSNENLRTLQQTIRELMANTVTVKGEQKSTTASADTEHILKQFLSNQQNIRTEFVIRHELVTDISTNNCDQQTENTQAAKQKLIDSLDKYKAVLHNVRDSATTTISNEEQHVQTPEQSTSEVQETTKQQETISSRRSSSSSSDCDEPSIHVQLPWSLKQTKAKNTEQSECVSVVDHSLPSTSKSAPSLVDSNQSSGEEQVTGPLQDDDVNTTNETQDTTTIHKDECLNIMSKYALSKLEERQLDNNKCIQQQQQQPSATNTRMENKIVRKLLDNGVKIEYSIPVNTATDPNEEQNEVNNNVPSVNPVANISASDTTPTDVCIDIPQPPQLQPQTPPQSIDERHGRELACTVDGQYCKCNKPQRPHNQQHQVQIPISTTTTHNQQPHQQPIVSQPIEVRVTPAVSNNNIDNDNDTANRINLPYIITMPPTVAINTNHLDLSLLPLSTATTGTVALPAIEMQEDTSHMPLQLTAAVPTIEPNIQLSVPQSATSEQCSSENERLLSNVSPSEIAEYQHVTTQPTTSTPYPNKRHVPVTTLADNTRKRIRTDHGTLYTNIPEAAAAPLVPVVEPMRSTDLLAAVNQRMDNTDNLIRTLIGKKKERKRNSSTATSSVQDEDLVSVSSVTSLDSYNEHIPYIPHQTPVNQHSHYHTPRSSYQQRPVIRPQAYHADEHLRYREYQAPPPPPPLTTEPLHGQVRHTESPLTQLSTMVHEHSRPRRGRARRRSEPLRATLQYDTEHRSNDCSTMPPPKKMCNCPECSSCRGRNHGVDSAQPHPELYRQFLNFIRQSGVQMNNHNHNTRLYPVVQMPPFPAEVLQSKQYKTLLAKYCQKPTTTTLMKYQTKQHTTNTKYKYKRHVQPCKVTTDYNNNKIITCSSKSSNNKKKNTTVQPITYPYPSDYMHRDQLSKSHAKSRLGIRYYGNKRNINNTRQSHNNDTISDQSRELVVVAAADRNIDSLFGINHNGGNKHAIQMATAQLQVDQLNSFIEHNRRMLLQDNERNIDIPDTLNAYTVTDIKEIHRLFDIIILTDIEQYYRSLWCMWYISDNKHLYYFYRTVTHLQIRIGQMPFAIRIFIDLLRRKCLCTIRKLTEDQYKRS